MFSDFLHYVIDAAKSPVVGWIGSALFGGVIGSVISRYYGDVFSEHRKKKKEEADVKKRFKTCREQMPELMAEMKKDLQGSPLKRDLVVLNIHSSYGGFLDRPFSYHLNYNNPDEMYTDENKKVIVHSHLLDKVRLLQSNGFVSTTSFGDIPKYRMTEEFAKLVTEM